MIRQLAFFVTAFVLGASVPATLSAQETRQAEDGASPPSATLSDVPWLVGRWSGEGIQGAPAMESWLPPMGGTMVGTFVQQTGEGGIMFTEHLYLMEEKGTLVLRLKHFNADLTGWEERQDMLTFRLVAMEECAAFFQGLTLRCADSEKPGEGLVAAVRMQSGKELVFKFNPVVATPNTPCPDLVTTLEVNQCYADLLANADGRLARYFAAAVEGENAVSGDLTELSGGGVEGGGVESGEAIAQMQSSQAAFKAYRDAECGAVWESWKMGTIRTAKSLICSIGLTDQRTHTIWENWLSYPDATAPILPKPRPTL